MWVVKEFKEKSFYSLSKRGKRPGAESGIGPEGWVFESFTEFKRQGAGIVG